MSYDSMGVVAQFIERGVDLFSYVLACPQTATVLVRPVWKLICKSRARLLFEKREVTRRVDIKKSGLVIDLTEPKLVIIPPNPLRFNPKKHQSKPMQILLPKTYIEMLYNQYDKSNNFLHGGWEGVLIDIHTEKTSINKAFNSNLRFLILKELLAAELLENKDLVNKNGSLSIKKTTEYVKNIFYRENEKYKKIICQAKAIYENLRVLRKQKIVDRGFDPITFEEDVKDIRSEIKERLELECSTRVCSESIEKDWKSCRSCQKQYCMECWEDYFHCHVCDRKYCYSCSDTFTKNWCDLCNDRLTKF